MKTKSKKINPPKGGNTEQVLTKEQVEWLDKCSKRTWRLNPQTGLVDVDGDFDCSGDGRQQKLRDLKGVRFGEVGGYFNCSHNGLTSLEGAPREVRGNFYCSDNGLTSLEGAPREVRGRFWCHDNQLTSLVGAPRVVGWDFYCYNNQLTTLEGAPREVRGDFDCDNNELTSLVGAPQKVEGYFSCSRNGLTSLVGAPRKVEGDFDCENNPVPETTLNSIFYLMKIGKSYQEVLEFLWNTFSIEDKILLWRPEFKWVDEKEIKTLKAMGTVNKLKGMI
jgi:hypothetical protein